MKIAPVFAGLVLLLTMVACQPSNEEKKEGTRFLVTQPLQKDTLVTRHYVCQIHAISHIELRALEKGYLQQIFVDEGQLVKKGQLMFRILPLIYEAEKQKAEAETQFAYLEYQNTKRLADSAVVSRNELALAKAKYDKARAELSLAQTHLGFTAIRAPFSGRMDHFQVRLGSLLNEGDLLTTLSDNSEMWVYFNVPEAEYLDYRMSSSDSSLKSVKLLMANNRLFNYSGLVKTIEADFNNETGNIAFRATFPNPEGLLRHGETGTIQMQLPLYKALLIPQKATYEVLEKKFVFVVDKNNVVHAREITVAAEMPDLYVVKSGLKESERILLEGIRKVNEGERIAFRFEDPRQVIRHLKVYVE